MESDGRGALAAASLFFVRVFFIWSVPASAVNSRQLVAANDWVSSMAVMAERCYHSNLRAGHAAA